MSTGTVMGLGLTRALDRGVVEGAVGIEQLPQSGLDLALQAPAAKCKMRTYSTSARSPREPRSRS